MRIYKQTIKQDGVSVQTKNYYTDVRLTGGRRYRLPLFESERLSRQFSGHLEAMLAQYESGGGYDRDVQRWISQLNPAMLGRLVKIGLIDESRAKSGKPINEHLADYISYLEAKGNSEPYRKLCRTRIENIVKGCKFRILADIQGGKIQRYISDELNAGALSQASYNHYMRAVKGFLRWLYREDRIQADIDKGLTMRTVTEVVKSRRALTVDEITYLLAWVESKGPQCYGLTGWQRSVLYRLALVTGLRANEIRSLRAYSIDFQNKVVRVAAGYTKNKKEAVLPLRDDILESLQVLTAGKLPDAPLIYVTDKTADLLRDDMEGARAFWIQEGETQAEKERREKQDDFLKVVTQDGEADFHGLRHSFGSMLANSGVHPKTAQKLLRHSTITLTMDRYSHAYRGAEAAAVDGLPSFEVQKISKKKA